MTLTDTVSHIAHDASEVANDLRKTAIELGRSAAGSDAAATAASTASSLAKAFVEKLPGTPAPAPRRPHWMRWAVLVVVLATVAFVVKRRRRPIIDPAALPVAPTSVESSNGHVQAARIAAS